MYRAIVAGMIAFGLFVGTAHADSTGITGTAHMYNENLIVIQTSQTNYTCGTIETPINDTVILTDSDTVLYKGTEYNLGRIECDNAMLGALQDSEIETWPIVQVRIIEQRNNGWFIVSLDDQTYAIKNSDNLQPMDTAYFNGTTLASYNTADYDLFYAERYTMPQTVYTVALPVVSAP